MGLSYKGEFDDVLSDNYVSGTMSTTAIAVEAKVGATRIANREGIRIYNNSGKTIYFGAAGVTHLTGEPLEHKEWVELSFGDMPVFIVTKTGTADDIRVQEYA